MPVGYTILLLSAKQGREINAMRRVVSENVSKRAQRYQFALNAKKSLCKLNSLHCHQKNHNLFVKTGTKSKLEKKELRPQANNAQYNTQGKNWGVG
jgi:hypothetical protein